MQISKQLISAIACVATLLILSVGANAQICAGSHLTYIVRDDQGKAIDASQTDLHFDTSTESGTTYSTWRVTGKEFVRQSVQVPEAISKLNGTLTALGTSGMCIFKQPVKLHLTWKGKAMNLTFLVPKLSQYDSRDFLVDSLPFNAGDYEIELAADPQGKPLFYAATGWKKVK